MRYCSARRQDRYDRPAKNTFPAPRACRRIRLTESFLHQRIFLNVVIFCAQKFKFFCANSLTKLNTSFVVERYAPIIFP